MKQFLLSCLLVCGWSVSVVAGGERLVGTWKSNKTVTLEYLKAHTTLEGAQLEKVGKLLGSREFTFKAESMTVTSDGRNLHTVSYKFLQETNGVLTFEAYDPSVRKIMPNVVEIDETGMWVTSDKIPGYKERFDKVVKVARK